MPESALPVPLLGYAEKGGEMNPRKQLAIRLRLEGCSYHRVAERLSIPVSTAAGLISPPSYISAFVKERAGSKCENCKKRLESGHIHHKETIGIDESKFNKPANLAYLCASCHRRTHTDGYGAFKHWCLQCERVFFSPLERPQRCARQVCGRRDWATPRPAR